LTNSNVVILLNINVTEKRKQNQTLTIQRHWQHRTHYRERR